MKIKYLILAIILVAFLVTEADADIAITVTDYTVYPEVFMQNDIGTIKVTVNNGGSTSANVQQVNLYAPNFGVITGSYSGVGSLGAGQSTTFTFALKATGGDGTYFPEVWITAEGISTIKYPIPVQVDSASVSIMPSNVPSTISSGVGKIEISVANSRSNQINGVTVMPEADGITFTPSQYYVGNLQPGDSNSTAFDMATSKSGQKDINLKVSFKNGDNTHTVSKTISTLVEVEPQVDVSLNEETVAISQGESELKFVLANNGDAAIKDLGFSWAEQDGSIVPVGSSNKKYVSSIGAGEKAEITYRVAAKAGLTLGVYQLTANLIYTDTNDNRKNQTSDIGIFVGGVTEFDVTLQDVSGGITTLSIANIGVNPAYSVVVKIPQQSGIVTTGSNSVAMGPLSSGDYTSASFQITQMNASTFQIPQTNASRGQAGAGSSQTNFSRGQAGAGSNLTVEIQYTDATGVRRSVTKEVGLSASAGTFATSTSTFGRSQSSPWLSASPYIVVAVLALVLVWKRKKVMEYLKRRRREV